MKLSNLITLDRVGDFWEILRQVDPDSLARDAHQPFRLVIVGPPDSGKRALAAALTGLEVDQAGAASNFVEVCDLPNELPVALPNADVYLFLTRSMDLPSPAQREQLRTLARRTERLVVVINRTGLDDARTHDARESLSLWLGVDADRVLAVVPTDRDDVARVVIPRVLALVPSLVLSIGRRLLPFRDAAAEAIVVETSRVNAEFVVVSGIPGVIPIIGTLAAAGADLVVLTKNQIMLLLKLAVLYQRPIDNRLQVLSEVAPIVGAAFVWRTAARTLVSLVPGPLAIAPQVGIAFIGTFVVGKSAQYYYRWGRRPSPALLEQFRQDAANQLTAVSPVLTRFGRLLRLP
ncbi:MAG TPA: hypothetical protein VFZ25_09005 [Chloroflexota bacterium]|nr:hypothetical protein [Chloroflexota bacterium]